MIPRFLLAGASLAVSLLAQTVTVDLTAAPGTATLAPGITVNAWLYNGTLPGPVLRVTEGQTLRVRFRNGLPEATAIHCYDLLRERLTPEVVRRHFHAICKGKVVRHELDNLLALNFLLGDSLGGGGSESLKTDAQGKTHGLALLLLELEV